ncbi:colicin immunity protein Cui, partial [Escherichia coli]
SELLLCHGMVCVVGRIRDLILQLSKSSIYSTKPCSIYFTVLTMTYAILLMPLLVIKYFKGRQ